RRVTDALGALADRGLEYVARAVDVDGARGLARLEHREREMDDDVGAPDGLANRFLVLHVALPVLGLAPALALRVERAPCHAHHALDSPRSLECRDDGDAEIAGRAGHRDGQPLLSRSH